MTTRLPHSDQHTPKPIGLRAELARLAQILDSADEPLSELAHLANADRLAFLFQVQLGSALRRGPDSEITPDRLLNVAQAAAAVGMLPLATPAELRRLLGSADDRLRAAGAWAPAEPPWWAPLPAASAGEDLWRQQRLSDGALPSHERLGEVFAGTPEAPHWLAIPDLLPAEITAVLHRQLELADRDGHLPLAREGVGARGRLSSRRSDSVLYLSGAEPELLRTAPTAAALVQWCLTHLGPLLMKRLSDQRVFAPRTAMLARYPAPSDGFHPHLDNPGGKADNGRTLTLVIYLNAAGEECRGGEIALWNANSETSTPPACVAAPRSGSAVLFDARTIAHQVRPLAPGPERWALTLWFNDTPQRPEASSPIPEMSLTEVLAPIAAPCLPPRTILFHELDDRGSTGEITVRTVRRSQPRVGIVSTVYRGGSGLDAWCEHHLSLGVDHLVLVFDHLDEPTETADAARLSDRYGAERLTVWSGTELAAARWRAGADLQPRDRKVLERFARSGASNHAIAARQTLNANVALQAARGAELGGAPLDWLLHLDADELFYLDGNGRGGARLADHFAASSDAGLRLLRYVNHELLPSRRTGVAPRFKLNPRLAAARLGPVGWAKLSDYLSMRQTDPRPYFTGYFNGKSAVAVAAARGAAGVHGWTLEKPSPAISRLLAGPSILHFHFASADAFRRKYLAVASSQSIEEPLLFPPSPVEVAARARIRQLQQSAVDDATIHRGLDELRVEMTTFSESDQEILEEAGLIITPRLEHELPIAGGGGAGH